MIMVNFLCSIAFSASHPDSSFDVVFSGKVFPSFLVHSIDILAEIARILKPNGQLTLRELTGSSASSKLSLLYYLESTVVPPLLENTCYISHKDACYFH